MAQFDRPPEARAETAAAANTSEMLNPGRGFAVFGAAAQSVMRGNMELMSFASRRTRAQMDLSRQAMACRSAVDLGQLGATYWRDAFHDYLNFNQRLMAGWTQSMAEAGQGDFARTVADFTNGTLQPLATAAEEAGAAVAEHPTEPWAWWRTDMKGLKPAVRNGNGNGHHDEMRVGP
jgi:hypothetical protein